MKNANNLLKDLLDREAIRELPARYCDCVWRNDIPALVKLFAPDGRFSMATAAQTYVAQGHAELFHCPATPARRFRASSRAGKPGCFDH